MSAPFPAACVIASSAPPYECWAIRGVPSELSASRCKGRESTSVSPAFNMAFGLLRSSAVIICLGMAHLSAQGQTQWIKADYVSGSTPSIAYEAARRRVVMFQGSWWENDTWEWDGGAWRIVQTANRPSARTRQAMVYNTRQQRIVLFGGAIGASTTGDLGDTWEYSGGAWTRKVTTLSPAPRHGHVLAYDSSRDRVVLFGGRTWMAANFTDTWEWDGTSWTQINPAVSPAGGFSFAMTYDDTRQRTLLVGSDGTWEWDGQQWAKKNPVQKPAWSEKTIIAHDSRRGRTVLYGGGSATETWEWNGANWQPIPTPSPSAGTGNRAGTYDPHRGRIVVCAFETSLTYAEWDGVQWNNFASAQNPGSGRSGHGMAYDPARDRTVVFGGAIELAGKRADTWEWDGRQWVQRQPASSPSARSAVALAYDEARQRVLLFGGSDAANSSLGDTWDWDGVTWRQHTPLQSPGPRSGHAMAYDTARSRIVLFGGSYNGGALNDTWEWDGTSWTRITTMQVPPPRSSLAIAYDNARQRTVLFGGSAGGTSMISDTWEYYGTNWVLSAPVVVPSARATHAMCYDRRRQRTVLFGGTAWSGLLWTYLNDAWEWDGSKWTPGPSGALPEPRSGSAMVYDWARDCSVLHGGTAPTDLRNYRLPSATWLYGALTKASSQAAGAGCAGTFGIPGLSSNDPVLAGPLVLRLDSARPNAACLFGLSSGFQSLPIGAGCTLYLQGTAIALGTVTDSIGAATVAVPIPPDAMLRAGAVHCQGLIADPGAPVLGVAFTGALNCLVGN